MSDNLDAKSPTNFGILYGSVIVVIFCSVSFLQWTKVLYTDTAYYLAFAIALGLGIAHVRILERRFHFGAAESFTKAFLLTALLMVISMILIAIIYVFLQLNFNFLTFLTAFIVPFIINKVYVNYLLVPSGKYKLSYYPFDWQYPDINSIDFTETIEVNFVLKKKLESDRQTSFTSRAPLQMSVSELFFYFIYEYNKNQGERVIEFMKDNEPFGWLFFVKKGIFQQKHVLDPDVSFQENGVNPDQIIYAVRQL